jgi:hypothetical protein
MARLATTGVHGFTGDELSRGSAPLTSGWCFDVR